MIAFIDDHRSAYGVESICRVLPIAPSTYYLRASRRADPRRLPRRAQRDALLCQHIRRVWEEKFRVYGARKVWRQLVREGFKLARCTVERLMKRLGLQGVRRGRSIRTTISDRNAPCPLDHVQRQFKASRPNALWVSDFTFVATWQGFAYVRLHHRCLRATHCGLEGVKLGTHRFRFGRARASVARTTTSRR